MSGPNSPKSNQPFTQPQQQSQDVATDAKGFKIPNAATTPTDIPNARFRSGDEGSWRQTKPVTTPDKSLEQGTGGRDVDDNSPFAEPGSSAAQVHAAQPKAPDHNKPQHGDGRRSSPGHAASDEPGKTADNTDPRNVQH